MGDDFKTYCQDGENAKGGALTLWILDTCYNNYLKKLKSSIPGPKGPTGDALKEDNVR